MADMPLRIGTYEVQFHVGSYFRTQKVSLSDPAFLDLVPVRFSIADSEGHYHVPLLVTSGQKTHLGFQLDISW